MITVKDFLEKITNPDRIKIVKDEEVLFTGYKGALVHEGAADLSPDILEAEMVSFRIDPEIRANGSGSVTKKRRSPERLSLHLFRRALTQGFFTITYTTKRKFASLKAA